MSYCAHCGANVSEEHAFCPYCGKIMDAKHKQHHTSGEPDRPSGWERYHHTQEDLFDPYDIAENKNYAVLAYLSVLVFIPLLQRGNSPYVRYHCNQGLILLIASVAVRLVSWVLPFLGGFIGWLGMAFVVICSIIGLSHAMAGRCTPVPWIGGLRILD